jgi:hypothetical protein
MVLSRRFPWYTLVLLRCMLHILNWCYSTVRFRILNLARLNRRVVQDIIGPTGSCRWYIPLEEALLSRRETGDSLLFGGGEKRTYSLESNRDATVHPLYECTNVFHKITTSVFKRVKSVDYFIIRTNKLDNG